MIKTPVDVSEGFDAEFDEDTVELHLSAADMLALSQSAEQVLARKRAPRVPPPVLTAVPTRRPPSELKAAPTPNPPLARNSVYALSRVIGATTSPSSSTVPAPRVMPPSVTAPASGEIRPSGTEPGSARILRSGVPTTLAPRTAPPNQSQPTARDPPATSSAAPALSATPLRLTSPALPSGLPTSTLLAPPRQPQNRDAHARPQGAHWGQAWIAGIVGIATLTLALAMITRHGSPSDSPVPATQLDGDAPARTSTEARTPESAPSFDSGAMPASAPTSPRASAPGPRSATRPTVAQSAPAPTSASTAPQDRLVRFNNPFDRSEVFEFPPGTSKAEARRQAAQLLLQRAFDRHSRR